MTILHILDNHLPFQDPILIFTLILGIILLAPILLNKLRVPHLIGLILAGALIGPNGFNLILRDSSFDLFGTVGLLYIMFLAGLEMDLNDFKKNSKKSGVFGLLTFSFPMILGTLSGYYILGFSLISSVLLASMFASHTLISYPIVSRLGIVKNPAVNITVGGTIITDTLALLVLSFISGMVMGEISSEFWIRSIISFIVFVAIVLLVVPPLGRFFFKRIGDSILQYIFVLTIVFISAVLAIYAGVEGIIGAFFAGLTFNRLIPRTSPLMNRIEFVGNALFIPFFLIGVGMLIDFRVLIQEADSIWIAVVITTLVLLGKYVAAFLTQKFFNYSKDQRDLIFGLSSSHAAATLAIVMIGMKLELFNEDILNATILMILVTCTISSFVTQKATQNIVKEEMTTTSEEDQRTEERILIPVNYPDMVVRLVNLSVILKNSKSDHNLYALNIIKNTGAETQEDEKAAKKILEVAAKTAAATDNTITEIIRYDIDITNAISSIAKENKITDIVMGLHKQKDISDSFLGSLTEGILSRCDTTTFIYKAYQPLSTVKRHLIFIPQHADEEIGFHFWLSKVWNIGKNTKKRLIIYATEKTISFIKTLQQKQPVDVEYVIFDDWNEFLILARDIKADDSLTIVMSRVNKPSYSPFMENIPNYLNKYFKNNNFILIYPIQTVSSTIEYTMDRLNPSLDHNRLASFRKRIRNMMKK